MTYTLSRQAMACRWHYTLLGDDREHLEAVAALAAEEVARLDRLLSRFDPASETSRLNREAGAWCRVDADVWELLAAADTAFHDTGGAFDIAAARGVRRVSPAWTLNRDRQAVRLNSGARFDFGGCGKGFALDRVEAILRRYRIASALISAGSSSTFAIGGPWSVPLRGADRAIDVCNQHLSVSATQHAAEPSDILAPDTGEPLAESRAVAALAASGLQAEIASTAALVLGDVAALEKLATFVWIK